MQGKKVLVTGAGGFIPSHVCEALVQHGARVRAFVHYNSRSSLGNLRYVPKEILQEMEMIWGDVEDPYFVRRAVEGCDVVMHLAALIGIPYSYHAPQAYIRTNVMGTLNVLQSCRDAQTPRVIQTSTSEVYGTAKYVPIDESHPLQGQSPYSASKIAADKLAESYFLSFELPVVTVRPFNTFGPRQSARAVIPTIAGQLLGNVDRLRIGALEPIRDLTYVTDTARGLILAGYRDGLEGETINLGTGIGVSIGELVERMKSIAGSAIPVETDPERVRPQQSEVMRLVASADKAHLRLSWNPAIQLDRGLELVLQFLREHPDHLDPDRYTV